MKQLRMKTEIVFTFDCLLTRHIDIENTLKTHKEQKV